jgi:hypothetical protein
MLKKVKSAEMSTCRHFQICRVFLPENKNKNMTDEQTDRQQIWLSGTLYCVIVGLTRGLCFAQSSGLVWAFT